MAFSPETYALLKAQGSGGSALPTPTVANVGQSLVVKPKQVAIVPEQSVAITQANDYKATLSNSNLSQLVAGWTYSVKIGSEEFTATAYDDGEYNMLATFTGDTTFWFWHDPDLNSDIVATDDSPFPSVSVAVTGGSTTEIEYGFAPPVYDAVIRLTHVDNSGEDTPENLTLSIVSGTYADLYSKFSDGGCPCVLVEYVHPWGAAYSAPMAYTVFFAEDGINLVIAGYSHLSDGWKVFGHVWWLPNETLSWD